jgi:hypothetical protein
MHDLIPLFERVLALCHGQRSIVLLLQRERASPNMNRRKRQLVWSMCTMDASGRLWRGSSPTNHEILVDSTNVFGRGYFRLSSNPGRYDAG